MIEGHHEECPYLEDPEKSCLCQYLNPKRDEAKAASEEAFLRSLDTKDPFFKYPTILATQIMEGNPPPGQLRTLATGILARDIVIERAIGTLEKIVELSTCPGCGCDTSGWMTNHSADCEYFPL